MFFAKFLISFWTALIDWFPWKRKQKPVVNQSTHYHVNDFHFPGNAPTRKGNRNKAYFDQHQKAPHNRTAKPNKHMRNLYKLEAR